MLMSIRAFVILSPVRIWMIHPQVCSNSVYAELDSACCGGVGIVLRLSSEIQDDTGDLCIIQLTGERFAEISNSHSRISQHDNSKSAERTENKNQKTGSSSIV